MMRRVMFRALRVDRPETLFCLQSRAARLQECQNGGIEYSLLNLISTIPIAERVKNQFDPGRDSQFFKNPIKVIPKAAISNTTGHSFLRTETNLSPEYDMGVKKSIGV
jgi:hypothetical protein